MREPRSGSPLATAAILIFAVLCCGLPTLIAVAGLAGGWFAAHGVWLGTGIAIVAAAALGVRWWSTRRA
ncbi:MAG TPA: hypothetical protein VMU65_13845 [Candidatus Saccharimonadales bacterium]|nr:hypothetical protein [Candidatus Saccharimonadales bacterium]